MISRRTIALIAVIVLMIVWGSTFVLTKTAVQDFPPLTLAALRFLIAALVLIPAAAARGGLARLPRPLPLWPIALMAVTGIAAFTVAFNYAMLYGSASQGALIFALSPGAVAIAAVIFLNEIPSRHRVIGIVLSIAGVALVAISGEQGVAAPAPLLGALCMLIVVAAWAWYTVIAKRLAGADQIALTALMYVIGFMLLIPFAGFELSQAPWPDPSLKSWLVLLFLGAIVSAAAYMVFNLVLRELDASLTGVFLNLDPIVGVITAYLFLGETLHGWQIFGGAIALAGMWLASREGSKRKA